MSISISLVVLLTPAAAGQSCAALSGEPSAWFRFDEPRFQTGTNFKLVPGQVGKAIQLDGKEQYIEVPLSTLGLDVGDGDFTVELWVRISDKSIRNIVDKRDETAKGYLIYTTGGRAGFQVTGQTPIDAIGKNPQLLDFKWHHIAGVVKRLPPEPIKIYVDGRLAGQSARKSPLQDLNHKVPLWIGRHHKNQYVDRENVFFKGAVDELAIFKRALSGAEILSIYQAGSKGKCRSQKN